MGCLLTTAMVVALVVSQWPCPGESSRRPSSPTRSRLVARILSLDMCRDRPSAIYNQTTRLHQMADRSIVVDASFYTTKTAQSFSKFELVMVKCQDAVSSNSCEYYQTWVYSLGVCDLAMAPKMPWSTSMDKIHPPFKCPLRKGLYTSANATVDLDTLSRIPIPLEGNIWRITTRFYNELKELHLCWVSELSFMRVKN